MNEDNSGIYDFDIDSKVDYYTTVILQDVHDFDGLVCGCRCVVGWLVAVIEDAN